MYFASLPEIMRDCGCTRPSEKFLRHLVGKWGNNYPSGKSQGEIIVQN